MTGWAAVEAALDGMLERRWYTNHGPLARDLEAHAAFRRGRQHAIAVVNPTIGLVMLAEALGLSGEVILSASAPRRCLQSLHWAGLRPRVCDVDRLGMTAEVVQAEIRPETCAVLFTPGLHGAQIGAMAQAAGLAWYADSVDDASGPCLIDLPGFGDDAGAACILTDDDPLAARLRNIRSSYGAGPAVAVARTANGRLSEAQAAMALLSLGARI